MKPSIYELLEQLRRRPGMFLGTVSVDTLQAFLSGLSFAQLDPGEPSFWDFQDWLTQRVAGISRSFPATWLAEQHGSERALAAYFDYLDEFRGCRVVVLRRSRGPFSPTFTVLEPPDPTPHVPPVPDDVVIGQFVPSSVFFVEARPSHVRRKEVFRSLEAAQQHAGRTWGMPVQSWTTA